jgi:hypothetical protein
MGAWLLTRDAPSVQRAFEQDLDAWLMWVSTVRTEHNSMRRLVRTYSLGWLAVTGTSLAIPWLGASAAVASVVLLLATLMLAFELTFPPAELTYSTPGSRADSSGVEPSRTELGPNERASLIRIMNLSRLATEPAARRLLRAELREARSQELLAEWPALRQLEEVLSADAFR